jgi:small-conductance mechanosensitive channel
LAKVVLLGAVCFWASDPVRSADPPAPADKAKSAETTKVELHRLKNDDLLKIATGIYEKGTQDYLAAARAIASTEILMEDAASRVDAAARAKVPGFLGPAPMRKKPTAEEEAQAALDAAKVKLEAAKRKLKLIQVQKDLLGRLSSALDAGQLAAVACLNALDDLKPYTIEIGLRVKDSSLAADKVPAQLTPESLDKKRADLAAGEVKRKQKAADAPKAQAKVAKQLEEANKDVLAAEADVAQAGKALSQEQKRLQMEKIYTRMMPDDMLADLARLVEEGDGLKGSYELALARFQTQAADVARLRKALTAQKRPESKIPQIARAEDIEAAAKSIQQLIDYYRARIKAIEGLQAALAVLAKQGGEFEADAAVSYEHLFKMNVVAGLLKKAGVPETKFPDGGQPQRVMEAAERQSKSAAEVQAITAKVKTERIDLDKQLAEAKQAGEAAAKQLANLKESQSITTAALRWEADLRGMKADQVIETFDKTRRELTSIQTRLAASETEYKKAAATVAETRAKLDGLKDPFLRQAEEQGQAEKAKITGELRKEAGLERVERDSPIPPPAVQKKDEAAKKPEPEKKTEPDKRAELTKMTETLAEFQQHLEAWVRVEDERTTKASELLASLSDLGKKATAYNSVLAEARQLALRLNAAASDLKRRVGKGEMASDKMPDGATEALRAELRTKLEADTATVLIALAQVEQEREKLRRPDADADALKVATKELLVLVGQRLDLLAEIKRLAGEYQREKKDRTPSEVKRLAQRAADRQTADGTIVDRLLEIDKSKAAISIEELVESYYQELIELDDKDENLKKQKDKIDQLIELTQKALAAVIRVMALLEKQRAWLQTAQDEEMVLARARLKPDHADELLKAYQTKTGRLLPKPVPVGDKEKADKVTELAGVVFERLVRLEAAKRWQGVLAARLTPSGLKAEAGVCQDELARVNSTAEANARRAATLTGAEPPEPGKAVGADLAKQPVVGGEIGKSRDELRGIRTEGVKSIAIRIAAIILAALLLPRVLLWVIRRAIGRGKGAEEAGLVLSTLRAFLKAVVWVTAFAIILRVLGFDVTAIVAGLGIGGLAIGLAAQPMLADMIAALVIFAEGKFKIGDVIRLGNDDPAKVIGLSWRSTQVRNADGLVVNIPNRKVTEQTVQNLTKAGHTYDNLNVTVTTQREVGKVLAMIRRALEECKFLTAEHGVSVKEFTHKGETKVAKYRFWWFVKDYEGRNKTRDEVFARITASLVDDELKGTEVTLA